MRIFSLLILINTLLFSQTINEQIHALEDASPEKRVELMNHIKEQLITMNQEERMKTLNTLRAKLQPTKQSSSEHQRESSPTSEHLNSLEHHEIQEQMLHHQGESLEIHQELHQYGQEERIENSTSHTVEHPSSPENTTLMNKGR
jgi:septal ring factor EnvC (AmiA/AmiB activator)